MHLQNLDWQTFEHEGVSFAYALEEDFDAGLPWENEDGHGPVSDWQSGGSYAEPTKGPGELILCRADRGHAFRTYDFQEAVRIARRDGWGWLPGPLKTELTDLGRTHPKIGPVWSATAGKFTGFGPDINAAISDLYAGHRASMTPRQYAAEAARRDFDRLRQFCANLWGYVGVVVVFADEDGPLIDRSDAVLSLWGIESDATEYHQEAARDLASELLAQFKARGAA